MPALPLLVSTWCVACTWRFQHVQLSLLCAEDGLTGADTKAWEVDTLRGHVNNVSCVMFHARQVNPPLYLEL